MPTWRGQSNHDVNTSEYSREINQLLHYLDENLKDDQKLYVNFHPIVQKFVKLDNYEHIYPFPSGVDKYEFLNSVDALITDYSSVFFDYSITRKPIILYMYDYEEYMHDRGMYFDIKELPFRKIYDKEALRDCLVNETFREVLMKMIWNIQKNIFSMILLMLQRIWQNLFFMEICAICQRSITVLTKKRNEEFCTIQT